jgi:uncharacterized membrane-anchored protein
MRLQNPWDKQNHTFGAIPLAITNLPSHRAIDLLSTGHDFFQLMPVDPRLVGLLSSDS